MLGLGAGRTPSHQAGERITPVVNWPHQTSVRQPISDTWLDGCFEMAARAHAKRGNQKEKRMKNIIAIAVLLVSGFAAAHSGGTDKEGCHVDHKTGQRHCH